MNTKPAKIAGALSLVIGIIFILTGMLTWGMISSQLKSEKITVPGDSPMLAGKPVKGPFSAYAQANIINIHALAGADGLTYAELGAEATKAKEAGDEELAQKLTDQRATAMNGSFLRASLFTSVLAYGVALMAVGVGVVNVLVGWALLALGKVKTA